jgi:hypothetical protein
MTLHDTNCQNESIDVDHAPPCAPPLGIARAEPPTTIVGLFARFYETVFSSGIVIGRASMRAIIETARCARESLAIHPAASASSATEGWWLYDLTPDAFEDRRCWLCD